MPYLQLALLVEVDGARESQPGAELVEEDLLQPARHLPAMYAAVVHLNDEDVESRRQRHEHLHRDEVLLWNSTTPHSEDGDSLVLLLIELI